jgi:hypothetical protein
LRAPVSSSNLTICPTWVVRLFSISSKRLKAEIKRATEERDILKKAATHFAKVSG